ncbi:MAG TPA: peptidoglycan-binding domain-containing protein [Candidatus Omnitrophota bacterium]|nr:peptidoglycan-binding domain-containing protein [Candidatus Omnitrophota bacterium]
MKQSKLLLISFLGVALFVTGCAKKSQDQATFSGTGFESLSSTEELAQLPQASGANQQAGIEILPVETSPVTQASQAFTSLETAAETFGQSLTQEQKIQTALKNAGLYTGSIDGKIGPASRRAIQTFQTNNGLKADGKVGPKTWAALEPYLNQSAAASQSSSLTQ